MNRMVIRAHVATKSWGIPQSSSMTPKSNKLNDKRPLQERPGHHDSRTVSAPNELDDRPLLQEKPGHFDSCTTSKSNELDDRPYLGGVSKGLGYFDRPMLIFDLETTGIDPLHDLPVSAALLEFDPVSHDCSEDVQNYFLVNPGCEIPPAATAIHGITTEQAREGGMPLDDAICLIYDAIVGFNGPVVGMNISYDLTMVNTLSRSILNCELPASLMVLDILVLDRHFDRYRKGSRKLADLARTYGVQSVDAHNALGDTTTTANVLMSMMDCYPEITRMNLSELVEKQKEWHYDWASQYSEWRKEQGKLPLASGEYNWPVRWS